MREEKGQEDGLVKCRETARSGRRPGRAGKAEGDQATQSTGKPNFFLTLSRFSPMPPLTGPFRLSSTQTLPLVFDAHPHGEQPVRSDDFLFFCQRLILVQLRRRREKRATSASAPASFPGLRCLLQHPRQGLLRITQRMSTNSAVIREKD